MQASFIFMEYLLGYFKLHVAASAEITAGWRQ